MSASLQLHDVAGSLAAPPFGQVFDVLLHAVPLDFFHRPLLHFERPNERLDRDHDSVENAGLSCGGQPVQHGDDPILLRVEPLLGPADDFCAFSHFFPHPDPAMCGFVHNGAPNLGSTPKVQISWDVLAHFTQNSRVPTARTAAGRPIPPGPHAPLPTLNPVRGPVGTACAQAQAFYSVSPC